MKDLVQLFRALTLRQILGLQLAWTSSLGLVFAFTTGMAQRDFPPDASLTVAYSMEAKLKVLTEIDPPRNRLKSPARTPIEPAAPPPR